MPRPVRPWLRLAPLLSILVAAPAAAAEGWPAAAWQTSSPEEQGMDSGKLAAMMAFLGEQGSAVHGILVVRHGRLVLEAYARPFGPDKPHLLYSAAKSFVSALLGIAIQDGAIQGPDQKLSTLFPPGTLGAGMGDRSLRDLLTMTSGVGEPQSPPAGEERSWLRYALATPAVQPPGKFSYSNVSAHMVLEAIARATGKPAPEYAQAKLFGPLGIRDVEFGTDGKGARDGGDRLSMLPRDLARFGYLYLRKGVWNGRQIVPAAWVEESTRKHVDTAGAMLGKDGYGYFWWMEEFGGYSALGYGAQYVFVVPEKDLVVVFTADMPSDFQLLRQMMKVFVVPAATAQGALPANAAALSSLRTEIERMQ